MKKIYAVLICLVYIVAITQLYAQSPDSPDDIIFVNKGQMYIKTGGTNDVAMYVPFGMRHTGNEPSVILNGQLNLGGNLYHDASTNIFVIDPLTTLSTSTGIFRFVKDYAGTNRYITTYSQDITTFDKGLRYVAFPHIEIATNDSIVVPGKMGIDASTLKRSGSKNGHFILRSDVVSGNAYDASLRITQSGTSASLVDLGSVVVERDMSLYRPDASTSQLFGFATPFKNTQRSGYYAGNWVRRPLGDGTYGHTTYVYANKDNSPADGLIDGDQYISYAEQTLSPAQAYLIKPRPAGFDYSTLQAQSGLWYTGEPIASMYDKGKFYFDGKVYQSPVYQEQLFADDVLYANTISTTGPLGSTVNWLIGNSYTSPISTKLLAKAMENSGLAFSPVLYVFPAGATTYQACDISGSGDAIVVADIKEIPAMSIFMVRVSRNSIQNGTLSIGKDLLRHADVSHNNPQYAKGISKAPAQSSISNQVTFRVSPTENSNIFDMAAIGLRATAITGSDNYDMAKVSVNDDNLFQLYTLSSTNSKLSANGVPLNIDAVRLGFRSTNYASNYKLEAKHVQSLSSEGLWLEDTKTATFTDLLLESSYHFTSEPGDTEERFLVHFISPISSGINDNPWGKIEAYTVSDNLVIRNLISSDLGSNAYIYDASGRLLKSLEVSKAPQFEMPFNYLPGVYVLQIRGSRTTTIKFVK